MENRSHGSPNRLWIELINRRFDDGKVRHPKACSGAHDGAHIPGIGRIVEYHVRPVFGKRSGKFLKLSDTETVFFLRKDIKGLVAVLHGDVQ